eukprot:6144085-Pleurochrysis_carterae.AAC.3
MSPTSTPCRFAAPSLVAGAVEIFWKWTGGTNDVTASTQQHQPKPRLMQNMVFAYKARRIDPSNGAATCLNRTVRAFGCWSDAPR